MPARRRLPRVFILSVLLLNLLFASIPTVRAGNTITVNTLADENLDNASCSLREAITAANTDAAYRGCPAGNGADTIVFVVAGTITVGKLPDDSATFLPLPDITQPVTIDALPGTGYVGPRLIGLDGTSAGTNSAGLVITAGSSTIRGLAIHSFTGDGIRVEGTSGSVIEANHIGLDLAGFARGNLGGVSIFDSPDNIIGGSSPAARNVISANRENGISVYGARATSNAIVGNYIGTDVSGMRSSDDAGDPVGNDIGVLITSATQQGATVASSTTIAENTISNSQGDGIHVWNGAHHNTIRNNRIGTDADGERPLPNRSSGVFIGNSPHNVVGPGNTISANLHGVSMICGNAHHNTVYGNRIGTDETGKVRMGNTGEGVFLSEGVSSACAGGPPDNTIGPDNIISDNGQHGVAIINGALGNRVVGNFIGIDESGSKPLGNVGDGVLILDSPGNFIGLMESGAVRGNVIGGNGGHGISIGLADNTTVLGNSIGTDLAGAVDLGNAFDGIRIVDSTGNRIGGVANRAAEANRIAHNRGVGVAVEGIAATRNTIRGNAIYANAGPGIDLGRDGDTRNDLRTYVPTGGSGTCDKARRDDCDTGPNDLLNYPIELTVSPDGLIHGRLSTDQPQFTRVDIYANVRGGARGFGPGEIYLNTVTPGTDGTFIVTYPGDPTRGGLFFLSATATDDNGNGSTSEHTPLIDIEVNQAIQDRDNSVGLIADKPGIVRVHVNASGGRMTGVEATLRLARDNGPFDELAFPDNPTGTFTIGANPAGSSPQRSAQFTLPGDWVQAGTIRLRAEVILPASGGGDSQMIAATASPLTFGTMPNLRLQLVSYGYEFAGLPPSLEEPPARDLALIQSYLRRMYPLGGAHGLAVTQRRFVDPLPTVDTPHSSRVFTWLNVMRTLATPFSSTHGIWLAIQSDTLGPMIDPADPSAIPYLGESQTIPGSLAVGQTGNALQYPAYFGRADPDGRYSDVNAAHEVGHALGLHHAVGEPPATGQPHVSFCNDTGISKPIYYPYPNGTIGGPGATYSGYDAGDQRPTLGLAPRYLPGTRTDIMTYCPDRWVSNLSYEAIKNYIKAHPEVQDAALAAPVAALATGDYLAVYGWLDQATGNATLPFVARLPEVGYIPALVPGPYHLRLLDGDGSILADHPFAPGVGSEGTRSIGQVVPFVPGTQRIVVYSDTERREVGGLMVSTSAPTVAITGRSGGPNLPASGPVTIDWTGNDGDSDALSYSLLYSRDNGATWEALRVGLVATSATVDATDLIGTGGTTTGRFRVIASDGVLTSIAESDSFAVGGKAPEAIIVRPGTGTMLATRQTLLLEGLGQDFEDGTLDGTRLAWSSDLDGPLGTGHLLSPKLSIGSHTITLLVTDVHGQTATAQVVVNIAETVPAPGPTLSAEPDSLLFFFTPGSAPPEGQLVPIDNAGTGALSWSASADVPWIVLGATSGAAPDDLLISIDTTGFGCDESQFAQITIVADGADDSPQVVTVTAQPAGCPILSVSPANLTFSYTPGGPVPAPQAVTIANNGGGDLTWFASTDAPWVGLTATETGLSVTVDTTGFACGTQVAHLTISAEGASGSPQVVTITARSVGCPLLGVSPNSLTFQYTPGGPNPASQAVTVENLGGGDLAWIAAADAPWISHSTTPTGLTVTINTAGLACGTHVGHLTITAEGAGDSPQVVTITAQPIGDCPPPETCVVTSAAASGAGTLREKVADLDCAAISFALPGDAPWAITVGSELPMVTRPLTITGPTAGVLTIAVSNFRGTVTTKPAFRVGAGGNLVVANLVLARSGAGVRVEAGGQALVERSTLTESHHGLLLTGGSATLVNSTISNTTVGLSLSGGGATVIASTFADNGTGVNRSGGGVTLINTIVASSSGTNCGGTVANGGHNLDDQGTCGFGSANGSVSGQPALLGPLAPNAPGAIPTHALIVGSPALDAGDDAACAAARVGGVDQRGVARPQGARCDIGAHEGSVASGPCVVTSAADTASGATLRAAVGQTGDFATLVCFSITFALPGPAPWAIALTSDLPTVMHALAVTGPSTGPLTIAGPDRFSRLFVIASSGDLALSNLILTRFNHAIYLDGGGSVTVSRSTLSDNNWAIFLNQGGSATVHNSTFSTNDQAAIWVERGGSVVVRNSTFSDQNLHSILLNVSGSVTVANSVLAGTGGDNCQTSFASLPITNGGHNLDDDGTCGFGSANGSISGQPALLGPLTLNGGTTPTHALVAGSPALDAGDDAACAQAGGGDQRGVARPQGTHCDIGAHEGSLTPQSCVVTSTADTTTGATLRAALGQTGDFAAILCGTIDFALPGGGPWTITLASDLPLLARPVTVAGPGAGQLTIVGTDGSERYTVFRATTGGALAIGDLTLARSFAGVYLQQGASATVAGAILRDNGHGARVDQVGSLTVDRSTLSGNGDGVRLWLGGGATVVNSTVSGNVNGVHLDQGGETTLTNSTLSLNERAIHGGGATLANTIVSGSYYANCDNAAINGGHNLADDASCFASGVNQSAVVAPGGTGLDPAGLQSNGGPTPTIALVPGSPALNAGNAAVCAEVGVGMVSGVDQRGVARPAGAGCDIGAVEYDLAAPSLTIDQAAGQADPTHAGPVRFVATFSMPVTDFDGGDIAFAGSTAPGALVATVTGGPTIYTVSVGGVTGPGTVVIGIAAGAATGATGVPSLAATVIDNSVAIEPGPMTDGAGGVGTYGGGVTLTATVVAGSGVAESGGHVVTLTLAGQAVCGAGLPDCPVTDAGRIATLVVPFASVPASVRGAGTHPGAVCATVGGGAATCGDLVVAKAALTVAIDDKSRPVGAADPAFTATYGGFVAGETVADLDGMLACTTTATAASGPGTYPITCSGHRSGNYAIAYVDGTLTVVVGNSATNVGNVIVTYGATSAALTATVAAPGPVNEGAVRFTVKQGDTTLGSVTSGAVANGATSADFPLAGLAAGDYTILADYSGGATVAASGGAATLTIAKAALTVRAGDVTRQYGAANPAFSATYSGFVGDDDAGALAGVLTCVTTATEASAPGAYPIACSGQTATNYTITYVDATLAVTKADQAITFAALADRQLTESPFTVSASAVSGLVVTFTASGVCTVSGASVALTDIGACTITANQAGDANFHAAAPVARSFQVIADPPVGATLTLVVVGSGVVLVAPPGTSSAGGTFAFGVGTGVTLTPQPAVGQIFLGWAVDGVYQGWADPLTLTMGTDHAVEATFVPVPVFPDVPSGRADHPDITELTARGIIRGYEDGRYGPDDKVSRAQMAALIARATPADPGSAPTNGTLTPPACVAAGTWDCEDWGNDFTDRGGTNPNLWRNIGALQHHGVAFGYAGAGCAARRTPSPCFGPGDPVTYAQTIAFITRAMITKGYWVAQPNGPLPDASVPGGLAAEARTFAFYTGSLPALPLGKGWNDGATRGWFAEALWAALDIYWGTDDLLPDGQPAGGFVP